MSWPPKGATGPSTDRSGATGRRGPGLALNGAGEGETAEGGILSVGAADRERLRVLRRYKAGVTGLLLLAAVIFFACTAWQHSENGAPEWVGYVRAAAEAGMVGGLADWFAVTALFRHPMRLPIPHTALIPRKKDQLGASLSEFVGENFLNAELITEKVAKAELPLRLGRWLSDPDHAAKVSGEVGTLLAKTVQAVDPKDVERVIDSVLVDKLAQPEWGPPLGRALDALIADGKTEPVIADLIAWLRRRVAASRSEIIALIDSRKPAWAPRFVHALIGDRIYAELMSVLDDIDANPHHEAREWIRGFLIRLADDLQHDPAMIARVEGWKTELMSSRCAREMPGNLWNLGSRMIATAALDETSPLRTTIESYALRYGKKLLDDPAHRDAVNRKLIDAASYLAGHYSGEITAIISDTVRAWDAEQASRKIELMVGKDLQFIRLNGTLVGSLAGFAIYAVAQLLF